jgi:TldD protein
MNDVAGGKKKGHFEAFGIDHDAIRRVLLQLGKKGCDFGDVFFQHRIVRGLGLEDGKVDRAVASVDLGCGIRAVKGEQTGYAYSEDLDLIALIRAADTAAAIAAEGGPRLVPEALSETRLAPYYRAERAWQEAGVTVKKPLLDAMNAAAAGFDPRIKKVRIYFEDEVNRILIADTDGRIAEDVQPMGTVYISCLAEQNGRREENYAHKSARAGLEVFDAGTLRGLSLDAAKKTVLLFDAIRPPPGEMPVVLAAGSSGILLHEAIGHGMEADFNRKNVSIYSGRIGERIAPAFVSIVDDATVAGARGAVNVDDEGNLGQRTVLVESGVLRSYMHDRISASHYKLDPTGNGRRQSFRHKPIPRMRCTYMLPGPESPDSIIASVSKGIYAVTFTNGQVQIGAGDFTFYIKTGFLIENGKLTRPIKDANIIGNGPKVLEQVTAVGADMALDIGRWTCGKDGQSVPVSLGLPTIKVASITVGGVKA